MPRVKIKSADRDIVRSIKTAMQGSVIRALVELITNSDDSYNILEGDNVPHKGIIEILYKKDGYRGLFAVRDYAAGMSIEEVEEGFETYGAETSGMKSGKSVRGYFGHGAKDALGGMLNGRFATFKDNKFVMGKIFIEKGAVWCDYDKPISATPKIRSEHKIEGNGTIACFEADPAKDIKVPQFDKIHEELANHYLLRKIMLNPKRKVLLINEDDAKTRPLRYRMPDGKEILSEEFSISYNSETFPIHVSIWRAEKELSQNGDDRMGGLLLVDEGDAILGISLFKYDNEPLAARFFGQVTIGEFRKLLNREEPVLSEARDGLVGRHPFCKVLIPEIEKRIEKKVKEEKLRKQREDESKIDHEEARRYKNAFKILNEIAEIEAQDAIYLGQEPTGKLEEPPNGFHLYPPSAEITVGKRYVFELRLNTTLIRHGTIIKIKCANPTIRIVTPEIKILPEDGVGILSKYITVEGTEPNVKGILQATASNSFAQSIIYVVPEKELLLSEGMVFQPETLTLHTNKSRKIYLLVYVKMIESGNTIKISSDNESIHISKQEIVVNEAKDAKRHVAKYELEVWGEGVGQKAIITAECESYVALLEAVVKTEDQEREKGGKGMFSEPEFNYDPETPQRTRYSSETGKVIIYTNFPSVQLYLGAHCRYRKTLPAQVLVADLVAERCFYQIAKKRVDSSGLTFSPAGTTERIERDAQELSLKYGKKVHEALVDQNLINEARGAGDL